MRWELAEFLVSGCQRRAENFDEESSGIRKGGGFG